jgi:DNA-binding response OmpR family regulator
MTLAEMDVLEPLALSRNHRILLVDDDPSVLAALRRALRREPYGVLATSSPEVALEWIGQGDVSLVVLDQRMPGMCGTELAERVRRVSPGTVRVMLTGYPGNSLVQHGLAADLQWLISKPWNDDALRLTIRRLLRDLESSPPPSAPADGAWTQFGVAVRRAAWTLVQGTRWIVGFLWMAEAR